MIKIVAALIERDGKYLIARRSTGSSDVLGKWEFPGGKVEENEDESHAVERKIMEEFELEVKAVKFLVNNVCEYPDRKIDLRLYKCDYVKGDFKLHDHSDYKFVSKDEIKFYDFCLADIPLVKYVVEVEING